MDGSKIVFDSTGARAVEEHKGEWTRTVIVSVHSGKDSVTIPLDSILEAHATWNEEFYVFPILMSSASGETSRRHFASEQAAGWGELGDHITLRLNSGMMRGGFVRSVVDDSVVLRSNGKSSSYPIRNLTLVELQPQPIYNMWFGVSERAYFLGALIGNSIAQLPKASFPGSSFLQNGSSWYELGFVATELLVMLASPILPWRIEPSTEIITVPSSSAAPEEISQFQCRLEEAAPDRLRWILSLHGPVLVYPLNSKNLGDDLGKAGMEHPQFPGNNEFITDLIPVDLAHVLSLTKGVSRHYELGAAIINLSEPEMVASHEYFGILPSKHDDTTLTQHLFGVGAAVFVRAHSLVGRSMDVGVGCGGGLARVGFDRSWTATGDITGTPYFQGAGTEHITKIVPFAYFTVGVAFIESKYFRFGFDSDYTVAAPIDVPDNRQLHIPGRSINLGNFSFGLSLGWQIN